MADQNEFGTAGTEANSETETEGRGAVSDVNSNLKSVGIDTDRMTEAAGERAGELQRLLIEEVRAQPLRALAWAAAAGVIVGFWAAK